jgi:lipopolysaccharide export system permease protein
VIISRYLVKEVVTTLVAVTLILLLIFLSNQLVRYLSYAAAGKIAASFVLQMLAFEIPNLLSLLLPLGLYLGIILAYGRLYADNELPVLNACGFGIGRLVYITSLLALVISLVVLVLTLWVNPMIATQKAKGLTNDNLLGTVRPGRFQVMNNGHNVVYVEKISRNRQTAKNIFIAEEPKSDSDNQSWVVVSAANAHQAYNPIGQKFIVTTDGYRYDGTPGDNDYKIIQFKKYAVRLPDAPVSSAHQDEEAMPTTVLWHHYQKPNAAAEIQWRVSMPITVFVLTLIAIPLSRVRPRQGRYANLLPAMLIYIVYVNLLFMARNWVEQKMISPWVGMWWVHVLLMLVAFLLLCYRESILANFLSKFRRLTI